MKFAYHICCPTVLQSSDRYTQKKKQTETEPKTKDMLSPICVFHCVTILGPLSRAGLMELLVGGFWFHSAFSSSSPYSMLRLLCPPPCTIVCACLRQSQAQNSFKFNSNVTFCVIFSLAFLFSFCVGIFGAFDKCSWVEEGEGGA